MDLYRPLKTNERELLNKLLDPDFPGRNELLDQLDSVSAKEIDGDGSLTLRCGPVQPAPVRCRVPTEGECADADGVAIHVLLHVADGVMSELEVFRDDLSSVRNPRAARDLVLFTPYGEAGVKWGAGKPETGT
jgi:uncharacterized protein DUF6984